MAIGCTWLVVAFASISMRSLAHMDGELVATIFIVATAASVVVGLVSAALVRRRPVLMVLVSQLAGFALISGIGSL
jgi:hypothetical protein